MRIQVKEMMKACRSLYQRKGRQTTALFLGVMSIACFFPLAYSSEIKYDKADRRDPFIPLVTADGNVSLGGDKKSSGAYKVEGIVFDRSEGSYALINGKFYKEGDSVDSAQLITILKDRVILSVNDTEKTLWLREEVVEKG